MGTHLVLLLGKVLHRLESGDGDPAGGLARGGGIASQSLDALDRLLRCVATADAGQILGPAALGLQFLRVKRVPDGGNANKG